MINYTHLAAAAALHMPKIGLGTLGVSPSEARPVINEALSMGYRLFDCAPVYFNEREIGDAFHESTSGVPRTDVFVTSKLACPFHRPEHVEPAVRKTLNDLRLGYLDLFLIHWPVAFKYVEIDPAVRGWENEDIDESDNGKLIDPSVSLRETWTAMEALVDKGLVKHIGVANFPVMLLHDLLSYSRIPPAVNQVEIHPYNQQTKLLAYCQSRNIAVQAYSPLGTPGYKEDGEPNVLSDPTLTDIANARGISVPQLCLQWSLQRGCHVIAKSSNKKHLEENLLVNHKNEFVTEMAAEKWGDLQSQLLSSEEMERIASLDRGYRFFRPEEWWEDMPVPVFH
eukprot:CAMPEP_0183717854 /NCGR_PEP_ID=MMETSP0737-20130205/11310_1 /TAXON_ID=385413 /ORGANISM="Thalassiosira miniscula, Strain CCMP1093" /LENGTH=338 /DNA_ID=CAMNT_0025947331 /DNA_START=213 /DNA_END=1229 /DNA_ORIENTATION=-